MNQLKNVHGYCRGSTDKQVITMKDQDQRNEEYGRRLEADGRFKDLKWVGNFKDPATSSKVPLGEREAGRAMLDRLRRGDHIVVTHLDRLFRNFREAAHYALKWRDDGVILHVTARGIDTSTSMGTLFVIMLGWMAEEERAMIRERTSRAARHRKKSGGAVCQHAGYGFKLVGQAKKKKKVEDPEERAVMGAIVELHDTDKWRFEDIYYKLLKDGYRTREGNVWSYQRIVRAYKAEIELRAKPSPSPG